MCSARQGLPEWVEAIDRLPVPAYALDLEGRIAAWNEPLSRLVGVGRDDVVGRGDGVQAVPFIGVPGLMLADLVLAPDRPVPDHLVEIERDGPIRTALLSAPALEPQRQMRVLASPIKLGDGGVGVVELILQPDPREVRALGSRAIFDRLMRTLRHDVLNQLTIVLGYIELARDGIEDPVANADLDRAVAAADAIRLQMEHTREFREIGIRVPVERPLIELVGAASEQAEIAGVRVEVQLPDVDVRADPILVHALEHLVRLSTTVEPPATVIRVEAVGTEPLVLRYSDDTGDGRWHLQPNGLPREMAPVLVLMQDVLELDGISLKFTDDSGWAAEISLPRMVFTPRKKEE